MIYLLGFLIIGQLPHSFRFDPISSPQTAGTRFRITVHALDSQGQPLPYHGSARIYVPGLAYPVKPDTIVFFGGSSIWQDSIIVSLAGSAIRLRAEVGGAAGESNQFQVLTGPPHRLLTILPGQSYAPGSINGKIGTVQAQQAGALFNVSAYLTDRWFNLINLATDSIRCRTSDQFKLAQDFRLNQGNVNFNFAFRTAVDSHRFYLSDLTDPSIRTDTSSTIRIYPGVYERLLVLAPGETLLPGDTAFGVTATPGKSGKPLAQYVLEDFSVSVYATDSMWNKTNTSGNRIYLRANDTLNQSASFPYLYNGEATFSINFPNTGSKILWAVDSVTNIQSYYTSLEIRPRAASFDITVDPDTIRPGEIAQIRAVVYDRSGKPIAGKWVYFSVLGGQGEILVPTVQTDSVGTAYSQFTCRAGYFDKLDTIGVSADHIVDTAFCYIIVPDSAVIEGELIAYPNPFGIKHNRTEFMYYLSHSCNVIFAIFDPFGNLVLRHDFKPGENGARIGINRIIWDGRNGKGQRVATGIYYVVVKGYTHTYVFLEKRIKVGVIW